jgi:ribosomal protein S18 acetylase RimI-like enzyme
MQQVYEAFQAGFSDYIIKTHIPREQFYTYFFEREGNRLEYSYIALDGERPVGIIFSGLNHFEGTLTLRCGALCIDPQYRGFGISNTLYNLHRQVALDHKCKQLCLEVIVGNDRAIQFYKKLGYEKVYDLHYYTLKNALELPKHGDYEVQVLEWTQVLELTSGMNTHMNWQNQHDYVKRAADVTHYGAYEGGILTGVLTVSATGKIYFLYTEPAYRHRGVATSLLAYSAQTLKQDTLTISFPNNAALEGFVKKTGFTRHELAQYEMYLPL